MIVPLTLIGMYVSPYFYYYLVCLLFNLKKWHVNLIFSYSLVKLNVKLIRNVVHQ